MEFTYLTYFCLRHPLNIYYMIFDAEEFEHELDLEFCQQRKEQRNVFGLHCLEILAFLQARRLQSYVSVLPL